ncbi:hypothetical protein [Azohydromonas caseinilytica]|uniref:Uncharacterized protein n=1 Tax=Azohydromonas caseinilytica TaxID=2728836 RepID=A0A848FI58_9BURK|nr:hypothetical protein [Azohydromonas caseinilytica]NML17959.1 hypothetical protein [Azohydromonas caseinilytica]
MLFKKTQPEIDLAQREYSWPRKDAKSQRLWVAVHRWDYIVAPSLKTRSSGSWSFQFKGQVVSEPLEGLLLTGAVELAQLPHPPSMLKYHWGNAADNVEGYMFLMQAAEPGLPSSLGATLYCVPEAFDSIYRAFVMGAQGGHSGLNIEMQIDHPGQPAQDFWDRHWQDEWLRVITWKLHARARLAVE